MTTAERLRQIADALGHIPMSETCRQAAAELEALQAQIIDAVEGKRQSAQKEDIYGALETARGEICITRQYGLAPEKEGA